jgi:hypothetical protein
VPIATNLKADSSVCVRARTCDRRIIEGFARAQPVRSLIVVIGMQALKYRVAISLAFGAAIVGLSACNTEQRREERAVSEFHQRLEQGRADLIYASSSTFLRSQFSEAQFKQFLSESGMLGRVQSSERAQYNRTSVSGGPDIVLAYYNTRYAKASCLEAFSWRVEDGALRLAAYSCARDMQVSCPGGLAGAKCETSPVATTALGFASLP